jgi:hypothetical protein
MSVKDNDTAAAEMEHFQAYTSDEAVAPEEAEQDTGSAGAPEQETTSEQTASARDGENQGQEEGQDDGKETVTADDTGADAKPKKAGRYQKRIDRLTRKATEAGLRAEEAERRLQEQGQADGQPAADSQGEPDPSAFDSYDDYLTAFSEWRAQQKGGKAADTSRKPEKGNQAADDADQKDTNREFTDALEDVQEAFTESRAQYDDFDDVVGAKDLMITQDMVVAMADTDDPGAIAYHLGQDKAETARIAGLSGRAQAKEIGKLEATLAKKPESRQPGKKTTQTPDPIAPVKGSDSAETPPEKMDFAEYEQTMNEREQKGGGFW